MCEMNYLSLFCKSYLVLFLTFIIGTPILCCTITDLGFFWYCSRDFWSWICESHALQAKDRTWVNCAVALSVSGASRSRLCPDGPCMHLSGPAYMPSRIRPEVRLLLDQRVLCSDCCKKCGRLWLAQVVFFYSVLHSSKILLVLRIKVTHLRSLLFRKPDGVNCVVTRTYFVGCPKTEWCS